MSKERFELGIRLHEKISLYATYICRGTSKMKMNYINEPTMLLRDLSLNKKERIADHIWIRIRDIKNYISEIPEGARIYLTGIVFAYYKESKRKIMAVNYSIKEINIISVDGLPLVSNT